MCCACCRGRKIQMKASQMIEKANEPLRDLIRQALQMYEEGLEIKHKDSIPWHQNNQHVE